MKDGTVRSWIHEAVSANLTSRLLPGFQSWRFLHAAGKYIYRFYLQLIVDTPVNYIKSMDQIAVRESS